MPKRTVVAVANEKGGAAKTTTAVNAAAALGAVGHQVLVIDLDPQGHASRWLGADWQGTGLYQVLSKEEDLAAVVVPTKASGVELVPAAQPLKQADKALTGVAVDFRLRRALDATPGWDFVIIDCPPQLGILVINALVASTDVLVPVPTHGMELGGLSDLLTTLAAVRAEANPHLRLRVLPCRMDRRTTLDSQVLDQLRRRFPGEVMATTVHESIRIAEAPTHGGPINEYDPKGSGTAEYAAVAAALADGRASHVG